MPMPENFEVSAIAKPKRKRGGVLFGRDKPGMASSMGAVAKITRDIKQGVTIAAENLGRDGNGAGGFVGYCEFLGWYHPKAFAHLLGKLLPLQITSDRPITPSITLNVVSIDPGNYLCPEDIEKLRAQGQTIEHTPEIELRPEPPTSPPIEETAPPAPSLTEFELDCSEWATINWWN